MYRDQRAPLTRCSQRTPDRSTIQKAFALMVRLPHVNDAAVAGSAHRGE